MRQEIVMGTLNYMEEHLTEPVRVGKIASHLYCSESALKHYFSEDYGTSIVDELNNQRILMSIPMLENTDDKILKIALTCGFASQEYYTEKFTGTLGLAPGKYRNLIKGTSLSSIEKLQLYSVRLKVSQLAQRKKEYYKKIEPQLKKTLS